MNISHSYLLATCLAIIACFSSTISANQSTQTLVLVGGALTTCSSMSAKNCTDKTPIDGKKSNKYQLSGDAIKGIKASWPSNNTSHRNKTLTVLSKIARQSASLTTKSELLWAWRDVDNALLNRLSDQEYNFVIDMLEIPVLDQHGERVKEQVNTDLNSETAANEILDFISATSKVNNKTPTLLAITASSRDPYESADFYEGLLSFEGIRSHWLALTPAVATAIMTGQCNKLSEIRERTMQVFNRHVIYPDRIKAEQALCDKGVDHLVSTITAATGVMFNGGDQSLTRKVMFDSAGQPYPWTQALRTRSLLVGTSAGTAVQSGGTNQFGDVAMITNGTSLAALRAGAHAELAPSERCGEKCAQGLTADTLTYHAKGGLGSFDMGILDTHFSERNRTVRLATLLTASGQQHGFGVDETTALVLIKSPESHLMTVVGKYGVVYLQAKQQQQFSYSYWPAGTIIDITDNRFTISQRSKDNALPAIELPPLPLQRFDALLTAAKLRSLTQAMCLSQEKTAVGQQDEFLVTLNTTPESQYQRINSSNYGCAISKLTMQISTIN
ncbi:cyanophycinase [Pseudoalteromonas mariniglutinosa]|uniref:cyanophycinase n=1 Tax=Pseudoalteromonas mariniglutinosa TaxID=206042 RepID=UPI00384F2174